LEGDFGFFILTVMLFVSGCDRGDRPSNIMVGYPLKGRPPATIHGQRCTAELAEEAFSLMEGRWKLVILYHHFGGDCSTNARYAIFGTRASHSERVIPSYTPESCSSMDFVNGVSTSPVCRVVTVSISTIPHSSSATGLCSVPFGTT
jgi:hypothetical protein